MMLLLTFWNCSSVSCQGRATAATAKEASCACPQKVGSRRRETSPGATLCKQKEQTCYPTPGPSGGGKTESEARPDKKSTSEMAQREGSCYSFKAGQNKAEMLR